MNNSAKAVLSPNNYQMVIRYTSVEESNVTQLQILSWHVGMYKSGRLELEFIQRLLALTSSCLLLLLSPNFVVQRSAKTRLTLSSRMLLPHSFTSFHSHTRASLQRPSSLRQSIYCNTTIEYNFRTLADGVHRW